MKHFNQHVESMKSELTNMVISDIDNVISIFNNHERIIFCTMGKSAFACAKIVYTARSYGLPWFDLDVCHAFHGDAGIIQPNDLLVFVSKSGETKEVIDVAKYFNTWQTISVTSNEKSTLTSICNNSIYIPTIHEGSPFGYAPMISTSLYMIVLHAILCEVIHYKQIQIDDYARNHPGGSIGKQLILDNKLSPKNSF